MKTLAVVRASEWDIEYEPYLQETLLYLDEETDRLTSALRSLRLVEIDDGPDALSRQAALKGETPALWSPYA